MSRKELYRFTLAEFLNAWKGYTDEKTLEQRGRMEAARLVLAGLVKKPPTFPWEKSDTEPYTEEEKRKIAASAEKKHTKKQILTNEGWKDVDS